MPTFSLCMIVKNEEEVLARCLDSIADLMDEIIIVDTGSNDRTKEIAEKYTAQVYDFEWISDFSAARNFSFSKATMDYIYTPDADEMLDDENRMRLAQLKQVLLPEIEIVQMKYKTITHFNTVLNSKKEYRPKLFKRIRTFTWVDPIHETIRTTPVIFDSDIEIMHMPHSLHSKRDFSIFVKAYENEGALSAKVRNMYARELLKTGDDHDFRDAKPIFSEIYEYDSSEDARKEAACILAHIYRMEHNVNEFFKLTLKDMVTTPCSEICYELGRYFEVAGDCNEAVLWYYNAVYETSSILDIHTSGDLPLNGLVSCYEILLEQVKSMPDADAQMITEYQYELEKYRIKSQKWAVPDEL